MAYLKLLRGIDIDSNYQHTIDFDDIAKQEAYFTSKAYSSTDKFLQIKDTTSSIFKTFLIQQTASVLRCEIDIEEARKCNYLMFKNDNDTKWYYAFIKQCYYLNEAVTIIEYEIDVVQTFLFDIRIENAFIEREHQDRWTKSGTKYNPIYNILPENINLGEEMKTTGFDRIADYVDEENEYYLVWCCFLFTQDDVGGDYSLGNDAYIDNFMGNSTLYCCFLPLVLGKTTSDNFIFKLNNNIIMSAQDFLRRNNDCPYLICCEILPYLPNCSDLTIDYDDDTKTFNIETNEYVIGGETGFKYIQRGNVSETLYKSRNLKELKGIKYQESFTPNQTSIPDKKYESKLLTYPYRFAQLLSNNGTWDIRYENISGSSANIKGCLSYYGLVINQLYIDSYLGDNTGLQNNLVDRTINELPIKTDAYKNYLYTQHAQAQTQAAMGAGKGLGQAILGGAAMAQAMIGITSSMAMPTFAIGASMMMSGIFSSVEAVASKAAKEDDLRTTPQTLERYGNDGTYGVTSKVLIPTIYYKEIKENYKDFAYNFFKLYGYRSNRFALNFGSIFTSDINIRSRYYYNYIKTADINIELNYSKDYQVKLVQIFNNGITFWHNRDGMLVPFFMHQYQYENWEVSLL